MPLRNETLDWQLESNESYLPIHHHGEIAGFLKREYASDIINHLNEDDVLKKALKLACTDLLKQLGSDTSKVDDLIAKYVKMSERPKQGTPAIAFLLRERQQELDLNNQEFTKFCDTFKLSPVQLSSIFAGEQIDDTLLPPLCRILGLKKDQLLAVRDGLDTKN